MAATGRNAPRSEPFILLWHHSRPPVILLCPGPGTSCPCSNCHQGCCCHCVTIALIPVVVMLSLRRCPLIKKYLAPVHPISGGHSTISLRKPEDGGGHLHGPRNNLIPMFSYRQIFTSGRDFLHQAWKETRFLVKRAIEKKSVVRE